jgi:spore coat polysaccharide biosynthesis predicted glycosyltransferase SpsG
MEYYTAAVQRLYEKHQDIELFIFSDDISWCRNNLTFRQPLHFVETNNAASDLYLMSQCRHNIIANSSFSWWGAWLNQNHDKIIIAPKQWIADKSVDTKDIIPESWVKL